MHMLKPLYTYKNLEKVSLKRKNVALELIFVWFFPQVQIPKMMDTNHIIEF